MNDPEDSTPLEHGDLGDVVGGAGTDPAGPAEGPNGTDRFDRRAGGYF